jgi:hypothetical protein
MMLSMFSGGLCCFAPTDWDTMIRPNHLKHDVFHRSASDLEAQCDSPTRPCYPQGLVRSRFPPSELSQNIKWFSGEVSIISLLGLWNSQYTEK